MHDRLSAYSPQALAVLRIITGLLLLEAGVFHVFGWPVLDFPPPPPEMATQLLAAGWLELAGGVLIIVGYLMRPTAFVLCGMMAVAYWGFHAPAASGPSPIWACPRSSTVSSFSIWFSPGRAHGAWTRRLRILRSDSCRRRRH